MNTKEQSNREIKFRCWQKCLIKNEWHMINSLETWFVGDLNSVTPDKEIIMQYTGLKDKNGKEIYEGDIIAFNESVMSDVGEDKPNYIEKRVESNFKYANGSIGERRYGRQIETVMWYDDSCGFEPFSDSKENCGHCGGGVNPKSIEIIGNIYENPNLLKESEGK